MQGTVNMCKDLGYTNAQAEFIGKLDDMLEEAHKTLGLCTGDEAEQIGVYVGTIFGKHTGKING
jgi:hypothetical protein